MNCQDFDLYGSAYIDNMLSNEEKLDFENHISECQSCNIAFENLKLIIEVTNDVEEVELPINFSSELRAKLELERNSKNKEVSFKRKKTLSGIVAGLLIIISSATLINNSLNYKKESKIYGQVSDMAVQEESIAFNTAPNKPRKVGDAEEEKAMEPRVATMDNVEGKNEEINESHTEDKKENNYANTFAAPRAKSDENSIVSENKQGQGSKGSFNKIINPFAVLGLISGIGILLYKVWKK